MKKKYTYKVLISKVVTITSETKWEDKELKNLGTELGSGRNASFDLHRTKVYTNLLTASVIGDGE